MIKSSCDNEVDKTKGLKCIFWVRQCQSLGIWTQSLTLYKQYVREMGYLFLKAMTKKWSRQSSVERFNAPVEMLCFCFGFLGLHII